MVGRDITQTHYALTEGHAERRSQRREKVLTVENVTMGMIVKNMSFSVYAGEVVGIAGLIGSGRTEIAKIIFGALKRNLINGGTIKLRGQPIRYRVPKQAINDGIAYITEDRKPNGFFETMVVDDNVYIGKLATKAGWRFLLSGLTRNKLADYWVERLKISALQRKAKIVELSGGNQQKVVIAKSLVQDPIDHHLRRADPRRRCRHHPGNPCPDPGACRRRQGGGRDLLLFAGDLEYFRSHPGGAAGPHRRRIRCRRCHRRQDHVRRYSLTMPSRLINLPVRTKPRFADSMVGMDQQCRRNETNPIRVSRCDDGGWRRVTPAAGGEFANPCSTAPPAPTRGGAAKRREPAQWVLSLRRRSLSATAAPTSWQATNMRRPALVVLRRKWHRRPIRHVCRAAFLNAFAFLHLVVPTLNMRAMVGNLHFKARPKSSTVIVVISATENLSPAMNLFLDSCSLNFS